VHRRQAERACEVHRIGDHPMVLADMAQPYQRQAHLVGGGGGGLDPGRSLLQPVIADEVGPLAMAFGVGLGTSRLSLGRPFL
jgi:hypothetical protein